MDRDENNAISTTSVVPYTGITVVSPSSFPFHLTSTSQTWVLGFHFSSTMAITRLTNTLFTSPVAIAAAELLARVHMDHLRLRPSLEDPADTVINGIEE